MGFTYKRIQKFVAQNRKSKFTKWLVKRCRNIINSYENYNFDFFANGEFLLLKRLVNEDFRTIFDIGTNNGQYAKICEDLYPKANIHCFEVLDKTIEALKNDFKGHKNVIINDFGLSDEAGYLKFNSTDNMSTLTSIYDVNLSPNTGSKNCLVKKGDDYVKEKQIAKIDFMKIDVEGMEHLVLKGFADTFHGGGVILKLFNLNMG